MLAANGGRTLDDLLGNMKTGTCQGELTKKLSDTQQEYIVGVLYENYKNAYQIFKHIVQDSPSYSSDDKNRKRIEEATSGLAQCFQGIVVRLNVNERDLLLEIKRVPEEVAS